MHKWMRGDRAAIVLLVLAYAGLAFAVLDPEVQYTGDIGVKYVQARALAANRFASLDMPYPGEFLDPAREFFPMREPFIMRTADETQAIFPPAFAVVQAVAVTLAGFHGLVLLSVLSSAVILYASATLAPPHLRVWAVLAVGLAGPLWFYASSGWEHAPGVALGVAAFALALTSPSRHAPALAGLLLGAGTVIRDEVFLLLPGMLVAAWLTRRSLKPLVVIAVAAAVPILAGAALDVLWFGRPALAHVRHAVSVVRAAADTAAAPGAPVPGLVPMAITTRYETVVEYWLMGHGHGWLTAIMAAGFVLAVVVRRLTGSAAALLLWCVPVVAFAAQDLYAVVTAPKWLAGLHRVAPYLVFALLPAARGTRTSTFTTVVWWTCGAYIAIAFAVVDTGGGKGLGPRLLLPLFPLLAVAAIATIWTYRASADRIERAIGVAGAALVVATVGIHMAGALPAYLVRNHDDSVLLEAVKNQPERIVVTEDEFVAQLLFPLYHRKIILLADSPDLGARLGQTLEQHRLREAVLVGRRGSGGIELPPFTNRRTQLWGRLTIQQWQR